MDVQRNQWFEEKKKNPAQHRVAFDFQFIYRECARHPKQEDIEY